MRKLSLLIICLLSGIFCYSQPFTANKYNKNNSEILYFNGKYGLIDEKHNWIINPIYDELNKYYWANNHDIFDSEGFLLASKNGKYGFINEKEEIKIPFIFNELDSFDKNGNTIASIIDLASNKEKFGVINRFGDWILKPIYEKITSYSEDDIFDKKGYLLVKNNNKFGIIDKNNLVKTPFLFDYLSNFDNKGFAIACTCIKTIEIPDLIDKNMMHITSEDECGIIDRQGNWIVQPIYDNIMRYSEATIFDQKGFLKVGIGLKQGFLDRKGKLLTNSDNPFTLHNYVNDLTISLLTDTNSKRDYPKYKFGIINRKGNWVIPAIYDNIENYDGYVDKELFDSHGFLLVKKNNKWGFVDSKNNIKIPISFDNLTSFDIHNHSIASKKDSVYNSESEQYEEFFKTGIIDRRGKWLLNPDFEEILAYRDSIKIYNSYSDPKGYLKIKKNDKWGFLDNDFKVKVPFIFDTLYDFDDKDFACACTKIEESYTRKICGFINRKGEWVITPQFELLRPFNRIGLAIAILNKRKGYINRKGELILEFDSQND